MSALAQLRFDQYMGRIIALRLIFDTVGFRPLCLRALQKHMLIHILASCASYQSKSKWVGVDDVIRPHLVACVGG